MNPNRYRLLALLVVPCVLFAGCGPSRPEGLCRTWVLQGLEMPASDISPDSTRTAAFLALHRGKQAFGLQADGKFWQALPLPNGTVDTIRGTWEFDSGQDALLLQLDGQTRQLVKQIVARTDTSLSTQDIDAGIALPGTLLWVAQ